jgi:transcriptional regulator with XRE-family HTH domain
MRSESQVLRHVGRRVAELREARGWTQEVFAERAGIGVGYVQQIEGGQKNPTVVTIVKLATVLGADAAELFAVPMSDAPRRGRPRKRDT